VHDVSHLTELGTLVLIFEDIPNLRLNDSWLICLAYLDNLTKRLAIVESVYAKVL
jgi:hypothetical protein